MYYLLKFTAGFESGSLFRVQLSLIAGALSLLVSFVAGCGSPPATQNAQKLLYEGVTVRVAAPKGWGFKESWELALDDWQASTGAKAELVEIDMTDGAAPPIKSDRQAELIVFPWTRRGELLAAKQLQALPKDSLVESQLDWEDIFQGLREKQGQSEAGPSLVPLASPILVCYYRADLLEKAGREPPQTWAEYQTLLDQLDQWAPGLKAVEPWSPEFRATMFFARALPYVKHSGHYSTFFDIENGNPFIDSPGFVKALEETQTALKKLPPEVFQYDPVTCRDMVVSGQAALAIGLETGPGSNPLILGAAVPPSPAKPTEKAKRAESIAIGFCRVPGTSEVYNPTLSKWVTEEGGVPNHVTLTGFAGLFAGIPAGTEAKQSAAALNLLTRLLFEPSSTSPQGSQSLCRDSQTPDASRWVGQDLGGSEAGRYVSTVSKSLRDRQQVSELPVLGHAEFRAALTKELTVALEQGTAPAQALASVAREWKQILTKIGQEKVLASYRSALGLSKLEEL